MIFYYAAGGGLGHLTRARAVLHTLRIEETSIILTASDFAGDKRVTGDVEVLKIPAPCASNFAAYRQWLRDLFDAYQPRALYLDAFPAGIVSEFCDFDFPKQTDLYYVARLLRWDVYSQLLVGKSPHFKTTYALEDLEAEHQEFLHCCSDRMEPLRLTDPPRQLTAAEAEILASLKTAEPPLWLIVHCGSDAEIGELVAYAEECRQLEAATVRLLLIAPRCPSTVQIAYLDFHPAHLLFPFVERIFTACGFNTMRQTERYKQKHRFMPFARKFDNQFQRAARRHQEPAFRQK